MHQTVPRSASSPTRVALVASVAAMTAASLLVGPAAALSSTDRGPSTTTRPYILPVADGVHITSVLTVGDAGAAANGYELVGIPDGLGLTREGRNMVVYLNHELRDTVGIARRHGQTGAFVARYEIDRKTLKVKEGSDLIDPGVNFWDYPSGKLVEGSAGPRFADGTLQDLTFGRFCSSTLSDPGVFYNKDTKNGYKGQIYFGNEEDGDNGRVFGVTLDGEATQLPRLGLFQWENTVPAPNRSDTTLVMGQEDGPGDGSQPWVYIGTKQDTGSAVDRAGLTNGIDYTLDAANPTVADDASWRAAYPKGTAAAVDHIEIPWNATGAAQNGMAKALGLSLNRIEDGHWDPNNPNDFYFLTTEGGDKSGTGLDGRDGGGLWLLRYQDIEDPLAGATLTLLLDGSEVIHGPGEPKMNKPDNMTVDRHGNVLIQEDPGNNNHLARIVAYRIADGALGVVARFDAQLFGAGATADPNRLTTDEESSGITDAEDILGDGSFVFDAQIHTTKNLPAGTGPGTVEEFVENGQLLVLKVDDWSEVYGAD